MKKRAAESDVIAMAAALAERRATVLQNPPTSGLEIQLAILLPDLTPLKGPLDNGERLVASISATSGQAPKILFIGDVELVDEDLPDSKPQNLYTKTATCLQSAGHDMCGLTQEPFDNGSIQLTLDPITVISGHKYRFNLLYAETQTVSLADLPTVTGSSTFDGSPNAPDATSGSLAKETTSTTPRLSNASSTNAGPLKPTETFSSDSSTATPPNAPATSNIPTGVASAPSKGLSTGAKAGIGVGVAAAVLIVIALIVAWWVRRSRRASSRNGRGGGLGEKESVLAAVAPGGAGEYRDADEARGGVVGGSPVARKPVGVPATNEAALADAVSPASTTVGVVRGAGGEGSGAAQESMLNAEERERWEEEERRLDEDIAEAERRRLGA